MMRALVPAAMVAAILAAFPVHADAQDGAAAAQVAEATRIAGNDLQQPLFLCRADAISVVREKLAAQAQTWIEPTRVFDDLYFIGNGFVGVLVLRTSAGLILFDSLTSQADARDHLVPDLQKLGLDPADIKYVVVTHGHYDHFGGAAWLQATYGAHVALSQIDWDFIEQTAHTNPGVGDTPRPHRDIVLHDGDHIRLGQADVPVYVTPGHTPGTISALLPVHDHGRRHILSLLGSTAFPANLQPSPQNGGLLAYDQSVLRFARLSAETQGVINTHGFADGTLELLALIRSGAGAGANPFLTGPGFVARYYEILHHCLLAAEARAPKP